MHRVSTPETDAPSVRAASRARGTNERTDARRSIDGTERDDERDDDDETDEDDGEDPDRGFQ